MNQRIKNLRKSFKKEKIDVLLVTEPLNIRYLAGFVGLVPSEREAYVLVTNHECYLITDGRYSGQVAKLKTKNLKLKTLEIKSGEEIVKWLNGLIAKLKIRGLGFEANNLTFAEYQKLKKFEIIHDRKRKQNKFSLVPTKNLVENLRAIKEPEEIKKIKKAAQIADKCFKFLVKFIKPGLTEKQIAWEIEKFIREKGADSAFKPVVAAGPNSSIPHHIPRSYKLEAKSLVLVDFGAKVDGYCSDMTRVVFVGEPTQQQVNVYNIVLEAQNKAFAFLTQSAKLKAQNHSDKVENPRQSRDNSKVKTIKAQEVDKKIRDYLKKQGFALPHGLGHSVGLSEHELPRLSPKNKDLLKPSMVFTIEPGVYLPGKFGIRIEDLVLLEKDGVKILTKARKEIIKI